MNSIISDHHKRNYKITIINSLLTILGNTIPICSGGACSSIYVSTITAFFSAIGISLTWISYIKYTALMFILISLFSLYSSKKNIFYKPFLLSFLGSVFILINLIFYESYYLLFGGNELMIVAAFWNSKINKANIFGKKNINDSKSKLKC